jgi:single-strand DNA-binding protein
MSVNKVILLGRVGKDPEVRTFQNGGKVASFSLATSERWKDKDSGENKERTEWHNVAVFGGIVNVVESYVTKGQELYVEGQLQTRKWQDNNGNDRYSTEVVLRGPGANLRLVGGKNEASSQSRPKQDEPPAEDFDDSDVPF